MPFTPFQNADWLRYDRCILRNIFYNNCSCADFRMVANMDASDYDSSSIDRYIIADDRNVNSIDRLSSANGYILIDGAILAHRMTEDDC